MVGGAPGSEARVATDVATRAGAMLLELRRELDDPGTHPYALRDRADAAAHDLILAALAAAFPGDPVLSEEARDDRRRLTSARAWIVDPLDGTREYGEAGRRDWAVHVAFWADGRLRAGAVALPALGVTVASDAPPPLPPPAARVRLLVSRSRPPPLTEVLRQALDAELVPMGSAGAKAMAVLRGEGDVYAHTGGQYEWDSAAPAVVAAAASLHTSRIDGGPLVYNRPDPYLPDLLICRPELAADVLAALG